MARHVEWEFLEGLRSIGANLEKRPQTAGVQDPTEAIETIDVTEEKVPPGGPVLVSGVTLPNIFRHPDAHPVVLDLLLLKKYGPEWMGWEPEVIERHLPTDFKTPSVSDVNLAKIHAVNTLHLVDTYWQQWEVFLWCTMALNGVLPDLSILQVPTVAQVLVSVDIANRIRADVAWSDQIKHFIEAVYRHDDIFLPVPPADFISLDTEGLPVDVAEIASMWPGVRATGKAPSGETVTNEQLRRLLLVTNYLEENRQHLRQQLPLVNHAQA